MVLDALLVVLVLVCLFVCFVIACHCKITAYVGDNKLILILSSYNSPDQAIDTNLLATAFTTNSIILGHLNSTSSSAMAVRPRELDQRFQVGGGSI